MPTYIDTSIKDFLNTSTGELLENLIKLKGIKVTEYKKTNTYIALIT